MRRCVLEAPCLCVAAFSYGAIASFLVQAEPGGGACEDHVFHLRPAERVGVAFTQRSASTTLHLPQPFGPTRPVKPGRRSNVTGSAKVLRLWMRSRLTQAGSLGASVRCARK